MSICLVCCIVNVREGHGGAEGPVLSSAARFYFSCEGRSPEQARGGVGFLPQAPRRGHPFNTTPTGESEAENERRGDIGKSLYEPLLSNY